MNSGNPIKKITNPLFSASVTGATVEDFTQNAILLATDDIPKKDEETVPSSTTVVSRSTENSTPTPTSTPSLKQEDFSSPNSGNIFSSFFSNSDVDNIVLSKNVFQPTTSETLFVNNSQVYPTLYSSTVSSKICNTPSAASSSTDLCFSSEPTSFPSVPSSTSPSLTSVPPVYSSSSIPPSYSSTSLFNLYSASDQPSLNQSASCPALSESLSSVTQSVPSYSSSQSTLGSSTSIDPVSQVSIVPSHPPHGSNHRSGSVNKNAYRRPGLKRPTYAQIPGLVSSQNQGNAAADIFTPQVLNISEQIHSVPDTNPATYSGYNDFHRTSILKPSRSPFQEITNFSSPVMSAVPLEEIEQTENLPLSSNDHTDSKMFNRKTRNYPGYRPVYQHWFYKREVEKRIIWTAFSMADSLQLETAFTSQDISPDKVVATDGGRFDVNILRRERYPVYWDNTPTEVRRCSWFYKRSNENHFVPYEENVATLLEEEYKMAYESNNWNKKVFLPNGDTIVLIGPDIISITPTDLIVDPWNNSSTSLKQKIIKRGMDEFDIDEGESETVDHLLFLVHGIGAACDFKFRSVEEVVNDFRSTSLQLVRSHYKTSCENGLANRIEILPIKWHAHLHSEETGIDNRLKSITLESIPRLRDFANNTLFDVFFYLSPIYAQKIISTVGNELNRLYNLFKTRNPSFAGGVSVGGHSLGSLILFDLLSNQKSDNDVVNGNDEDVLSSSPPQRKIDRRISYIMSKKGTGQQALNYPRLEFNPVAFFALGSPIGIFVTVRGLDNLGEDFAFPTCPAFFNIFHPYDPIAYRMESLINSQFSEIKPVLIPHHKGRKRMHLELKDTMVRVGADLKQKIIDSMKSTLSSLFPLNYFSKQENSPLLEAEVEKVIENEIAQKSKQAEEENEEEQNTTNLNLGILNKGRRIDYVLQEAPFEFFNEYIFALTSHVCYWESEDTMLLILKEIYGDMNIQTDSQIPQQTLTIEKTASPKLSTNDGSQNDTFSQKQGIDPTVPINPKTTVGPPPMAGFIKKK